MKIKCPKCGNYIVINGLGRKPLNVGVNKVCDALRRCHSVKAAAEELGCSRGYIYRILKENGLNVRDCVDPKR